MRIALIADAYPPLKTSGAVLIRDLAAELARQGHGVTVLLPDPVISGPWELSEQGNIQILRLRAMETKDVNYFRRALAEYLLSTFMYGNLKKSPFKSMKWQAVIWYSPSIFFGALVKKIKKESGCPAYLVLRDIFPEWAVDMGLLSRGLIYRYFKSVEKFQYRQADTIGVQTPSILGYFRREHAGLNARLEVLYNWMGASPPEGCSIRVQNTALAGRKVFVYTGNIGVAQGMDILIDLAHACMSDKGLGFLFVGRGSAVEQLKKKAAFLNLDNILFHDEIDPDEIPGLLAQCHVGLIALDPRHRNDNIPGKFLSYMHAGLPVLANINAGNDLEAMIRDHRVGKVVTDNSLDCLKQMADELITEHGDDPELPERCRHLVSTLFSPEAAARQIVKALENTPGDAHSTAGN